ncbi:hypothetical protein LY78DRAFT_387262 [Colletotrichum sublineola]|nr:hypothetical protein LY78DRAFT_387262 [Colletotrichum sublineola]
MQSCKSKTLDCRVVAAHVWLSSSALTWASDSRVNLQETAGRGNKVPSVADSSKGQDQVRDELLPHCLTLGRFPINSLHFEFRAWVPAGEWEVPP